ncbi:MAG: hypothetical protein Q6370_013575 [Candidatus Sigynarchaeota archaeon]
MTKRSKRPTRNPFKKPPKGYKRKPNDGIEDYHAAIERALLPGVRKRGVKVDGYEINVEFGPDRRKERKQPEIRKFGGRSYFLADREASETIIRGSRRFDPEAYNNFKQNMHAFGVRFRIYGKHVYTRKMSEKELSKQREREQARRERRQQEHDAG